MKKRILFLLLAVVVLTAGIVLGYLMAMPDAEAMDKPQWQVFVEQKVLPIVTTVVTAIASYYIMNYPAISKINAAAAAATASAAGFDGAAGGIVRVATEASAGKAELAALKAKIEAMEQKHDAHYADERKILLTALKMIGTGFSHEAELVKNGAAREIMQMEEEYDEG